LHYFSTQDGLALILLIVDYHASIGAKTSVPLAYAPVTASTKEVVSIAGVRVQVGCPSGHPTNTVKALKE